MTLYVQMLLDLETHPKTEDFAEAAGLTVNEALGVLYRLWQVGVKHARDGDLSRYTRARLAARLDVSGETVDAMAACGWLDCEEDGYRIHDWHEGTGGGLTLRAAATERKRAERERRKSVTRQSHVTVTAPSPVTVTPPDCDMSRLTGLDWTGLDGTGLDMHTPVADAPAPPAKKPKARKKPPKEATLADAVTTLEELCLLDIGNGVRAVDFWRLEFPAYDGINGRPSLREMLEGAFEYWLGAKGKKKWKTIAGFTASLRRGDGKNGYLHYRGHWQRDPQRRQAPAPARLPQDQRLLSGRSEGAGDAPSAAETNWDAYEAWSPEGQKETA